MNKKNILLTGGLGLIGSAVAKLLLEDGRYNIRIVDNQSSASQAYGLVGQRLQGTEILYGDLTNLEVAKEAMGDIDICIHLAGTVGGIANFHKLPFTLLCNNNGLLNAVFSAAISQRIERIIYISSSVVYEKAKQFPTTEAYLADCPIPRSIYGLSKLGGEYYCRAAWEEYKLPYTIVRPFNAYGLGEIPGNEPGIAHVIPDLIKKVLSGQRPIEIMGTGNQTRCFTHIKDIARALKGAIEHPGAVNEDFNISSQQETSILDLARLIWNTLGNSPRDFQYVLQPSFEIDVQQRRPSTEKAFRILGWKSEIALEDGIADLICWYRHHQLV